MGVLSKGFDALLTLYRVIIHLVLIVIGGSVGLLMMFIILLSFGSKTADYFLDAYLDVILTIGGDSEEEL